MVPGRRAAHEPTRRFTATVDQSGTNVYVRVPFDPDDVWGAKDRHYVQGSVRGRRIRGVLISDGRQFCLPLGPAWRRDNAVGAGETVEVELGPDGPQPDLLARDLSAALDREPEARRFFESIAPFYRKNYVRWIETAKRPETRAARIHETVRLLKEGKDRH
jgi:hypothetical protein